IALVAHPTGDAAHRVTSLARSRYCIADEVRSAEVGCPEPLTPFRQDRRALFRRATGARIRNWAGGSDLIDGGSFLIIGIAIKALRCAPHVDRSAGFRLNDRDLLSVDRRPCAPARHLVPPFSIVLARLFRRQYRHSEYGRFLIQTERTRDLVAD